MNINQEQEAINEEICSVDNGIETIKKSLMDAHDILKELKEFKDTGVGSLIIDELNSEYQRLFKAATTTEDANIAKANLDQMKGVGFAMAIVGNLVRNLEDDIENLRSELEYQEAGAVNV